MSDEEYQKYKTSLIECLLEENKNMWDEACNYSYHIKSGYYDFLRCKVLLALNNKNIFYHRFAFIYFKL
jgi:secreted Zn-dependent insulinase-like peptidase